TIPRRSSRQFGEKVTASRRSPIRRIRVDRIAMKRAWLAWVVFGFCAAAMLVIIGWGSRRLILAEESEKRARREAEREEGVRLSLWRMDTALAALVIQETSRPYAGYLRDAPAPASPYVKGRFELGADGRLAPPRAAEGLSNSALESLSAATPKT